jgi:uncharacterized membrane protein YagU involved in acid resistance
MNASYLRAILLGGCMGGAGDIAFAIAFAVYNGSTPVKLLQVVASGLLGNAAFTGGIAVAALGLALHFLMSFMWAGAFVAAAAWRPSIALHPVVSGIVFGIAVFLVMRLVVLPLSAFPFPVRFKPLATTLDLLSHVFLFGLPIVWAARRAVLGASAAA